MSSDTKATSTVSEKLRSSRVEVDKETYTLVSLAYDEFAQLLQKSDLSPRGDAPFMILADKREVTLMLDETDYAKMRLALLKARIERGFRLITFDIDFDFKVTGFLAEVSRILADAKIPILALSAFSRDHVLVKQEYLANTLKALSEYVDDLC
jgi:hypothetical protein